MLQSKSKISADSVSNINLKIGVSFFILLFVIILLVLSAGSLLFKKVVYDSEDRLAKSITNVLSLSINRISFSGKYHAQIFSDQLLEKEKDLVYIIILDENGEQVAKSVSPEVQGDIVIKGLEHLAKNKMDDDEYHTRYRECCGGLHVKEMILPYKGSYDRSILGAIAVGLSTGFIERKLFKNNLILLLFGVGVSFMGMVLIFLVSNKVSFPIRQLALIFQGILNHAPMNIVVRDRKGNIIESSKDFRDTFFTDDEEKNSNIEGLFIEKDLNRLRTIEEEVIDDNLVVKREMSFQGQSGKDHYMTLTFDIKDVESRAGNEILCSMAININEEKLIKDELERKSREARKASEAKGNFLATMSHEIRTPLTSIIGFLSLLKGSDLTKDQLDYVQTALGSSENLLSIINDILDYSKIESQELKLDCIGFSMTTILKEIQDVFTFQVQEKKLSFNFVVDQNLHDYVYGDEVRIRQILTNLVGNAIKFTEKGGINIYVSLMEDSSSSQLVRFEVQDSGIGLRPQQIDIIFDRFSQADSSISRKFGGTGLGLSICQQLVELMDGKIWVESDYGHGASFIFNLPLKKLERPKSLVRSRNQLHSEDSYTGKKVLIADDESSNRKLIELFLKDLGLELEFAENGEKAANLCMQKKFDLVLMDVQMPDMDGVESLRLIRKDEEDEGKARTPIYAFTANVFKEQLDGYAKEGFDGHFTKPFKKAELIGFIKGVL